MSKGTTYCIGLSVFLGIFSFVIAAGGGALSYIHIPSALFVLGAACGLGLAGYRGNGFVGYVASCKKYLIIAGVLGTIIGTIQLLANLSNPEDIGGGLAVALLTLLYSVILYGMAEAFVSVAGTKQTSVIE